MNEIPWQAKKSGWRNTEIWKAKGERWWTTTRVVAQDSRASPHGRRHGTEFGGRNFWFNTETFLTIFFIRSLYFICNTIIINLFWPKTSIFTTRNSWWPLFSQLVIWLTSNNCTSRKIDQYFSKYWGDRSMGRPPTSNVGGPSSPKSPPVPISITWKLT